MPNSANKTSVVTPVGDAFITAVEPPLKSVVDQMAAFILGMILSGELAPGAVVAIKDLSRRFNISHVPVREALQRLQERGLVEFRRGKRPRITPLNVADFEDVFRLRRLIEGDAAKRSSTPVEGARLRLLEDTMREFESTFKNGRAFDVFEIHARFHLQLLSGVTEWERRLLTQLITASERYIQLYVGADPEPSVIASILDLHWKLVSAARSGIGLTKQVIEHLDRSVQLIKPAVSLIGGPSGRALQQDIHEAGSG